MDKIHKLAIIVSFIKMEAQTNNSVDARVQYALEHHFTDPRAGNLRNVLSYLGENAGSEVSTRTLREVAQMSHPHHVPRLMSRLIALTDAHTEALGFRVKLVSSTKTKPCNTYILEFEQGDFEPAQRRRVKVVSSPTHIPVTDSMKRCAQLMTGGHPLMRRPTDEKTTESLFHNARFTTAGGREIEHWKLLTEASRRNMAVNVGWIKDRLDVPTDEKRLEDDMLKLSEQAYLELGFVVSSVKAKYHAIFFLEPPAREEALFVGTGITEHPALDRVIPFNMDTFRRRLKEVSGGELDEKERNALREITRTQESPEPSFRGKIGLSKYEWGKLKTKSLEHRHEWGLHVRCRGDHSLQCVLLDKSV